MNLADVIKYLPDASVTAAEHDQIWLDSKFVPNHAFKDEDGEDFGIEPDAENQLSLEATEGLLSLAGIMWTDDSWSSFV